jgi:CBS domain-containing protein
VVERGELVGIVTTTDLIAHALTLLEAEGKESRVTPTVSRLMSPTPVTTIQEREHLDLASVLMSSGRFRHLPVMSGNKLVGIISDRDILAALEPEQASLTIAERLLEKATIRAEEVMSRSPTTVAPDQPAIEAGQILLRKKIGALPVLRQGKLIGILTEADFLTYLLSCGPREDESANSEDHYNA